MSLRLELLNSPADIARQAIRNHSSFSSSFSLEDHVARKRALAETEYGASGYRWTLLTAEGDWTATCETYHSPGLYVGSQVDQNQRDAKQIEVAVKKGIVASVGGVFTPPHLRGKGYAREMMIQLGKKLQGMGCLASNLYSAVGPDFYGNLGWKAYERRETVIRVPNGGHMDQSPDSSANVPVSLRSLSSNELFSSYLPADVALLSQDLLQHHAKHPDSSAFTIVPTRAAIEWFHARSTIFHSYLRPGPVPQMTAAFAVGDPQSGDDDWSYCVPFASFSDDKLYILRIRLAAASLNMAKHATTLLRGMISEARRLKLSEIVIWEPPRDFNDAAKQLDGTFECKIGIIAGDLVSSLRCWLPGEAADQPVCWLNAEKFAWV